MRRFALVAAVTVLALFWGTASQAAQKQTNCRWDGVTETQVEVADQALVLTLGEIDQSLSTHLPWGAPINPFGADNERRLVNHHFIINHDGDLRTATWTAHRLRAADLVDLSRHEAFRSDPRLDKDDAATCQDYVEPIYDQGHLVPSGI